MTDWEWVGVRVRMSSSDNECNERDNGSDIESDNESEKDSENGSENEDI